MFFILPFRGALSGLRCGVALPSCKFAQLPRRNYKRVYSTLPACLSAYQAALDALAAVTETIRKEDSVMYIKHIRKALAAMASADPTLAETGVPGFNLKKGLAPLLPILKHGLMFGMH